MKNSSILSANMLPLWTIYLSLAFMFGVTLNKCFFDDLSPLQLSAMILFSAIGYLSSILSSADE